MVLLIPAVKHKQALIIPHTVLTVVAAGEIRLAMGRVTQRGEVTYEMMLSLGARHSPLEEAEVTLTKAKPEKVFSTCGIKCPTVKQQIKEHVGTTKTCVSN